jgi:hypothetical protein
MSIEKQDFKPGEISTNLTRASITSKNIISTLTVSTREAQITAAGNRTNEATPSPADMFTTSSSKVATTNQDKQKELQQLIKENLIKEQTSGYHEAANKNAQALLVSLISEVFPEGVPYLNRAQHLTDDPKQAQQMRQEDFGRLLEEPKTILQTLQTTVPAKLAELKQKAKDDKDPETISHYDKVDEIIDKLRNVWEAGEGNGSHLALLNLLNELDHNQINPSLKGLITNYHKSLNTLGKEIQRAGEKFHNVVRHPMAPLLTGVPTKTDQGQFAALYTRPVSLAAAIRDHRGGIMGSFYDFKDTDWSLGGIPWEYGQNVKGDNSVSASYPIRRLAGEMRGYIGQLTEAQPGPMFVTTDVDAKLS